MTKRTPSDDYRDTPITMEVPGREPVHTTAGAFSDLAESIGLRPPPDSRFGDEDYMAAPELAELAERLLDEYEELDWLKGWPIEFLWRKKGGKSGGNLTLGKTKLASGLDAYYSHATWIIWVAADHCFTFNPRQIEAVIYHELLHPWHKADEDGEDHPEMRGHEWEGFRQELERYGAWKPAMREIAKTVQQLKLWEEATA